MRVTALVALAMLIVGGELRAKETGRAAQEEICPAGSKPPAGACPPSATGHVCKYPKGVDCVCQQRTPCSGVPASASATPMTWVCHDPPPRGCPVTPPSAGGRCGKKKVSCTYGECAAMTFSCEKGAWRVTAANGPPPSMAVNPVQSGPVWKQCPSGRTWGCHPISRGIAPAPGEVIPTVCGCVPDCSVGPPNLIVGHLGGERWPDGSTKGSFSCASSGIP